MDTILGLSQSQNHKVQAKAILLHTFLAYTYPSDSLGPITGSVAGQVLFLTAFHPTDDWLLICHLLELTWRACLHEIIITISMLLA